MEALPGFEAYVTHRYEPRYILHKYGKEIDLICEILDQLSYEEANKIAVELVKKYPSTETYHKMLQELSNDWTKRNHS